MLLSSGTRRTTKTDHANWTNWLWPSRRESTRMDSRYSQVAEPTTSLSAVTEGKGMHSSKEVSLPRIVDASEVCLPPLICDEFRLTTPALNDRTVPRLPNSCPPGSELESIRQPWTLSLQDLDSSFSCQKKTKRLPLF